MTSEESQFFELLDRYSKTHHKCFLAEMFLNKKGTEYVLCFRPGIEVMNPADRSSCRYLRINPIDVQLVGKTKTLTTEIKERLDRELKSLS